MRLSSPRSQRCARVAISGYDPFWQAEIYHPMTFPSASRVPVTGASGMLGSAVVRALAARGEREERPA